ncbi:MAG: Cysteate synthase [ANME-2 cluster archaeon HR1]|nr:MAG: Cysteate synthase [ANME-2 cluster archaeon HR1]
MNTITPSPSQKGNDQLKYTLTCVECGSRYPPDALTCSHDNGLLRTHYNTRQLYLQQYKGMGKFLDWLPVDSPLTTQAGPITYKSTGLANELGLSNLYIGFNGYWPQRDAKILTCSFKELEAHPTLQRMCDMGHNKLVLASAGNTARAFAHVSKDYDIDVYIIVSKRGLDKMWLPEQPSDKIHFISLEGDYTDAINLAARVANEVGMRPEGGARNVARRDGMGTVMLDAAVTIGRIPDHYFQSVGSGTGAIAAWEASLRLIADGRFGDKLPKLHMAQNLPFAPIMSAWQHNRREIIEEIDMPDAKEQIKQMYTDVLSNRQPPYSFAGGIYDALCETNGQVYGITNEKAQACKKIFEDAEGIDITAPAAVTAACLIDAVDEGSVGKDDCILLNITAGGVERLKEDYSLFYIEPEVSLDSVDVDMDLIF